MRLFKAIFSRFTKKPQSQAFEVVDESTDPGQQHRPNRNRPDNFETPPTMEEYVKRMIQAAMMPTEREETYLNFKKASPNQPFQTGAVSYEEIGNVDHKNVHDFVTVTASSNIAKPEDLKIVCSECGGMDNVELRCEFCNLPLCRLHICTIQYPNRIAIFCKKHHRQAAWRYDTWSVADTNKAKRISPNESK